MIDPAEAASALASAGAARRRAGVLRGYAHSGEVAIVWGIVWLTANLGSQWDAETGQTIWRIGIPVAVIWTILHNRGRGRGDWRVPLSAMIAFGYILAIEAMLGGVEARLHNAITSLLVAAIYVALGLWGGARFGLLGLALAACVLLGWFVFPGALYLWLGLGGGGVLIATGLWLRRA